jgi:hypothetical protein
MTDNTIHPDAEAGAADALIADYLERVQAGEPPDRTALLAGHPECADDLREFFADLDRFNALATPLRQDPPDTGAGGTLPKGTTPAEAFPAGRRFGDYELLGEIARGAMGVVYRARQRSLNRVVALKMILAGEFASPAEVQRFRQEAESAAALDHPHIVPIYEVGEHDGHHFFSMKLIEGGSLAGARAPGSQVGPKEAARLVAAAARAVHYAHQRGVIHRDLKPANILLDRDGQPHVTDFGLAKRVAGGADQTQSGAIVGTAAYMPPEQARGQVRGLTTAADVYGLGAVLYELLAGRPPFQAATVFDVLAQVQHDDPAPPSRLAGGVPRDLETICLKCIQKEPERRYSSAEALAEDLGRWLRDEPITARPLGRAERVVKWARRKPAIAALLAAVTLITLAAVGGMVGLAAWALREAESARKAEGFAKEEEQRTQQALDEADTTLAESLLRPIGRPARPEGAFDGPWGTFALRARAFDDLEVASFSKLASLPRDQTRLRFLEAALGRKESARRVRLRADLIAQTLVGLDRGRKAQVEQVLAVRMSEGDAQVREACALLLAAIGPEDANVAADAALFLSRRVVAQVGSYDGESDWDPPVTGAPGPAYLAVQELTVAIARLSNRLSARRAAEVMGHLLEAQDKAHVHPPGELRPYGPSGMMPHLLREPIAALTGRVGPSEAAELAHRVLATADEADPGSVGVWPWPLEPLLERLSPEEAEKRCTAGAARIMAALGKESDNQTYLAGRLAALARHLRSAEAERLCTAAAGRLMVALSKTNDLGEATEVVKAVEELAGLVREVEAASLRAAAMRDAMAVIDRADLTQGNNNLLLGSLTRLVGALSGRVSEKDAGGLARRALDSMLDETKPQKLNELAILLGTLAGRLRASEGGGLCAVACQRLLQLREENPKSFANLLDRVPHQREGWEALLGRLGEKQGGELAGYVVSAMGETKDTSLLSHLAVALRGLSGRLSRAEAEKVSGAGARRLLDVMRETAEVSPRLELLAGFDQLSGHLGEQEADAFADLLLKALDKKDDTQESWAMTEALSALGARLSQPKVVEVADRVAKATGKLGDENVGKKLEVLRALSPRLHPALADEALDALQRARQSDRAIGSCTVGSLIVALAGRLSSAKVSQAAEIVLSMMPSEARSHPEAGIAMESLTRAFKGLAGLLDQKEAQRLYIVAIRQLVAALGNRGDTLEPNEQLQYHGDRELLEGIAELAEGLGERDAAEVAERMLRALGGLAEPFQTDRRLAQPLLNAMSALSNRMGTEKAAEFAQRTVDAPAQLLDPDWYLGVTLGSLAPRLSEAVLVNLLKGPFCTGAKRDWYGNGTGAGVRDVILAEFGKRTGQTFRSQWDFVDWAVANRPELDFSSPYRPPVEK